MKLQRWNYKIRQYEPYEVPDTWNVSAFCAEMDEIVTCPHCGENIPFGEGYTSREIHTATGMGYAVCESCYEQEWERAKKTGTVKTIYELIQMYLNKEPMPRRIKYDMMLDGYKYFVWSDDADEYICETDRTDPLRSEVPWHHLLDEVEIIEGAE